MYIIPTYKPSVVILEIVAIVTGEAYLYIVRPKEVRNSIQGEIVRLKRGGF